MRYRLAAPVAVAGIATGAALAVATPVTPQPGAVVTTSHPLFTWTLPSNAQSSAIYIANNPAVTPEGRFYDENVVDADVFFNDERQWSPTTPLYAGAYWWLVWSNDRNTFVSYYSTPASFTVCPLVTLLPLRTRPYLSLHWLDVNVRWRANVRTLTVKVRLLHRGKVIWKRTENDDNLRRLDRLDELTRALVVRSP